MIEFLLYYTTVFAFLVGAAIGSFLNVVIYRVPEGLSVVKPASRCPKCESEIRWFDNIPILSWFILRGGCRNCGCRISPRYAFVEFLTASVAAFIWFQRFEPLTEAGIILDSRTLLWVALPAAFYFFFACLLITLSFIDLDHFLLPHEFTVPGMVVGLAAPWVFGWVLGEKFVLYQWPPVTPWVSLIGFLAGGLIIIIVFYAYLAARGVEGMGGGDVTLMAMVGAWLGWPALIFILFASSIQGLIAAGLSVLLGVDFVKDAAEIFADDDDLGGEEETEAAESTSEDEDLNDQPDLQTEAKAIPTPEDKSEATDDTEDRPDMSDELNNTVPTGKAAIPFGPFISLSALEYLLFGLYLPPEISLVYFYY